MKKCYDGSMKKMLLIFSFSYVLCAEYVGMVEDTFGEVQVKRDNKIINVSAGYELKKGDILITAKKSSLKIIFKNKEHLKLGSKRLLSIDKYLIKLTNCSESIDLNMTTMLISPKYLEEKFVADFVKLSSNNISMDKNFTTKKHKK